MERKYKHTGQRTVKPNGHIPNKIYNGRFAEFWSVLGWETPDTQNSTLKDEE